MACTIIVGGQWGDEAKGKIASYLALRDDIRLAARGGLGPGAGHTVVHGGATYKLRQIPSAILHPHTRLLIGAGTLIRPEVLLEEIASHRLEGRVGIDRRATLIEPKHVEQETASRHLTEVVASTRSGHGPALAELAMRSALRAVEEPSLQPYLTDVSEEINAACDRGEKVLLEGTNGTLLSVLYGTYPHTVAKDATASTVAADVGVGPRRVEDVVLVFKTYPTRVGAGVFPTEMDPGEVERRGFLEYGTVTGRRRRVGTFDFDLARGAVRVNHPSFLALTFLDRIDPGCRGSSFEGLSREVRSFIDRVESELQVPVSLLGTGPDTFDIIDRRETR
jgi:adenylosuccinate synthase